MKNKNNQYLYLLFVCILACTGCADKGCTDANALNYNPAAKKDDGSCIFVDSVKLKRDKFVGTYLVSCTTEIVYPNGPATSTCSNCTTYVCASDTSDLVILVNSRVAYLKEDSITYKSEWVFGGVFYGSGYLKGDSLFTETFSANGYTSERVKCKGIKIKATCN